MTLRVNIEREEDYYGDTHREEWLARYEDGAWTFTVTVYQAGLKTMFKKGDIPPESVPQDVRQDVATWVKNADDAGLSLDAEVPA